MFGYVVINKPELKIKEFDTYRGFYCGLCKSLKSRYGIKGQISLNYDLNFIAILLSALYEPDTSVAKERCVMHPLNKQTIYSNEYLDYCADMTILLTYYKCKDDWYDDHSYVKAGMANLYENSMKRIKKLYPEKCLVAKKQLEIISEYEKNKETDIDKVANAFGIIMGEICAMKDDEWKKTLNDFGFYLGKFIYLIDAYEDIEKDIKSNSFNLFKDKYKEENFEDNVFTVLEMMIVESSNAFEKLPILENGEVLRNVLYSGVWTKYELIKKKRGSKDE